MIFLGKGLEDSEIIHIFAPDIINSDVNMDLKKKIKSLNMTQEMVADIMKVTPQAVSNLVNSDNPSYQSLKNLADALGISVSELVSDETNKSVATIVCPKCGEEILIEAKNK